MANQADSHGRTPPVGHSENQYCDELVMHLAGHSDNQYCDALVMHLAGHSDNQYCDALGWSFRQSILRCTWLVIQTINTVMHL